MRQTIKKQTVNLELGTVRMLSVDNEIRPEKETPARGLGPLLFIVQGCVKVGKALGSDWLGSRQAA